MILDYYASLAEIKKCPRQVNEGGLASGFVDGCTVVYSISEIKRADAEQREKFANRGSDEEKKERDQRKQAEKDKNEARQSYINRAKGKHDFSEVFENLPFEPDFANLPVSNWFGIEVSFTLQSPWYSKDDRAFHVMDNPVRKDKVIGIPYMSASMWKGMLRWSYRMQSGLYKYLEDHDMKMTNWKDPDWIVHLFGNEKGEKDDFRSGSLVFYPTWFNQIGFEVINPHDRARRAGTQPIYYEVVPAGVQGTLRLLYAPMPREMERDKVKPDDFIILVDSIQALLETYGISAKRTAGWGLAKIEENGWSLQPVNENTVNTADKIKTEIKRRFARQGDCQ